MRSYQNHLNYDLDFSFYLDILVYVARLFCMSGFNFSEKSRALELLIGKAPVNPSLSCLLSVYVDILLYYGYDTEVIYDNSYPLPIFRFSYKGEIVSIHVKHNVIGEPLDDCGFDQSEVYYSVNGRRFKGFDQVNRYIRKTYPIDLE